MEEVGASSLHQPEGSLSTGVPGAAAPFSPDSPVQVGAATLQQGGQWQGGTDTLPESEVLFSGNHGSISEFQVKQSPL